MHNATHCYVAKRDGEPGAYAACVDMPDMPKETAKFVSEIVKDGGIIERVSCEQAGKMLQDWFLWKRKKK